MSTLEEKFWRGIGMGPRIAHMESPCWLWTRGCTSAGYGVMSYPITRHKVYAHRFSYELHSGDIPTGYSVDHRCHHAKCVRPDHLRAVSHKENMENRRAQAPINNSSGVRGVHWDEKRQRWVAQTKHNGRHVYIGRFTSLEDATEAVKLKRLELFAYNDLDRQ